MPHNIDQEELEVFIDEVDELLQILEEDVLELEKQPGNQSILQEIFRAAHTIKGSASVMGFETLATLSHAMETVFDGVRKNVTDVSPELVDVFLKCIDTISTIRTEIVDDLKETSSIEEHLQALKEFEPGKGPAPKAAVGAPPQAAPAQPTPAAGSQKTFRVDLSASPDCRMIFVRALQVLTFISEIGNVVASSPTLSEIENEERAFPLSILLSTTAAEGKVRDVLKLIMDVRLDSVRESSGDEKLEAPPVVEEAPAPEPEPDAEPVVAEVPEEPAPPVADVVMKPEKAMDAESDKAKDAPPAGQKKKTPARTVRVDVSRMDALMDLVGELVINKTRLTQLTHVIEMSGDADETLEFLGETADNIEMISSQLQENIMKARLLPIENVFNKFPRMVRDLAKKSGKKIEFEMKGADTELDRSVLEEIGDPLMHAIRNSIDHGIEPPSERVRNGKPAAGKVTISASHVEDHILIVVEDDGRGIDKDKVLQRAMSMKIVPPETRAAGMKDEEILDLVFTAGFSTKDQVSEISGRGVGMDVVRNNIEKLNGSVVLNSTAGKGTKIEIKLPLTLAIIKSLLVTAGDRIFAVPVVSVIQTLRVNADELQNVRGKETILFRGSVLPLLRLNEIMNLESSPRSDNRVFIVVISWGGRRLGVIVDFLIGDQEIVIRPLGEYIGEVPGISGAAILGDGRIALILDISGIVEMRGADLAISAGNTA